MSLGINKAKVTGFISAFILLILSYVLLFVNTRRLSEQALWVEHTNQVITNLEYLASEYRSVEISFRGFIGTRRNELKENYFIFLKRTDSLHGLLRTLTWDVPFQQNQLDSIRHDIDIKVASMSAMIDTAGAVAPNIYLREFFRHVGFTGVTPLVISNRIKQMEYFEKSLLQQRAGKLKKFNDSVLIINIVSFIIALILAVYSLNVYLRENKARREADKKAELYRAQIESRVKDLADANKEIKELRNIEKFASTGRIARTIAHEVRNPLTNINLAAEQLKESIPDNEENSMLLDMVKRNGLRINQLISNLLHATKFSELKFEKTDLNDIIDQALELAEDRINLKRIHVEKNYDNSIPAIGVDEEKLKIAFLNIIMNAVEAMETDSGVLKLSTENLQNKCRIVFGDNGTGMNDETLSKLFEPFFTSKEKGNGLGLTNTQNVILNHKGKIEVESTEGKGSTFIVTLDLG
jgi:signal transduction histidine kinase